MNTCFLDNMDYYPFGMQMPSRSFTGASGYRFGFNGKEKDTETSTQDYGLRIYNPALGKFLSVDPLTHEFPWNSTYAFAENDVIRAIDLEGAEKGFVIYSPIQMDKIKCAFEVNNYKEVMRIIKYALSHDWVDNKGKKSDYHKRLYEKLKGGNHRYKIPNDKSARIDWNDKDQFNIGMIGQYGKQENGKGWLRVEYFNIETEEFELLGIIPIAKQESDGISKMFTIKDDDFWNIEPTLTRENRIDLGLSILKNSIDGASTPINPIPFNPQSLNEEKAKIYIEGILRTMEGDATVIAPLLNSVGDEIGVWSMKKETNNKGGVTYTTDEIIIKD